MTENKRRTFPQGSPAMGSSPSSANTRISHDVDASLRSDGPAFGARTGVAESIVECDHISEAALMWYRFGLRVAPVIHGEKQTAEKWAPWLHGLSTAKVRSHWLRHPSHDVGAIIDDRILMLDADSKASIAAIELLEDLFQIRSRLVVATRKGMHYYYKRAKDTFARSDSHSTETYPSRIDVKTGRALVILPPSTHKILVHGPARTVDDLTEVHQAFIDEVFLHNGRVPPRPIENVPESEVRGMAAGTPLATLRGLLDHIDPDLGYDDWLRAMLAIYFETAGSEAGFELVLDWSRKGRKYPGRAAIAAKWRSFVRQGVRPITIGTLIKMVSDAGFDYQRIILDTEPGFQRQVGTESRDGGQQRASYK